MRTVYEATGTVGVRGRLVPPLMPLLTAHSRAKMKTTTAILPTIQTTSTTQAATTVAVSLTALWRQVCLCVGTRASASQPWRTALPIMRWMKKQHCSRRASLVTDKVDCEPPPLAAYTSATVTPIHPWRMSAKISDDILTVTQPCIYVQYLYVDVCVYVCVFCELFFTQTNYMKPIFEFMASHDCAWINLFFYSMSIFNFILCFVSCFVCNCGISNSSEHYCGSLLHITISIHYITMKSLLYMFQLVSCEDLWWTH